MDAVHPEIAAAAVQTSVMDAQTQQSLEKFQGALARVHAQPDQLSGATKLGTIATEPGTSQVRSRWVAARHLRTGDTLITADGQEIHLSGIETRAGPDSASAEPVPVFNFEVQSTHTYFVGAQQILAHNACANVKVTKNGDQITRVLADIPSLGGGTGTTKAARNAMLAGDDAGHIIGKQLGGKGGKNSDNIFSQNPHINRGAFAQHEGWVAQQVREGKKVRLDIQLQYDSKGRVNSIIYDVFLDGNTIPIGKTFGN